MKSPTSETVPLKPPEIKKTDTELHWEELVSSCSRALTLCDLDFTDLPSEDELSVLVPTSCTSGIPPPPPLCFPPPIPAPVAPPPLSATLSKNKKTVKLFWKVSSFHASPFRVKAKSLITFR